MKPSLTLIVPAFNPPKGHFEKCCYSIEAQITQFDYEVVVVDDHSNLESASEIYETCDKFGFQLIRNEKNLGVSRSRNEGIAKARSEYIAFLDADDCIYPDFIEGAMQLAVDSGADCVIGDLVLTTADSFLPRRQDSIAVSRCFRGSEVKQVMGGVLAGEDFMPKNVAEAKAFVHAGPVARLYKREIIFRHDIHFDPCLTCGEDIKFNLDYLAAVDTCVISNVVWYQYKQHPTSATNGIMAEQLEGQVKFCADLLSNQVIRTFGMEQAAYGRILGGLKTLIRRVCVTGRFGELGETLSKVSSLINADVFQIACHSINPAQFYLCFKDRTFVWLCRMRAVALTLSLTRFALFANKAKHLIRHN